MYTLYYSPGAASMLPHLLLREIGASHELRAVDIKAGANRSAEYLQLNPGGLVPTLLIDGKPHVETAALLLILCERHPEANLAPPPGATQRQEFLQGVLQLANTLQPAFRLWFYPADLPQADAEAVKAGVRTRIEESFTRLDAQLEGRDYLLGGDQPSALDFYAVMLMRWSRNMPRPATEWPRLKGLADRIRARDSWRKLYEIEGLTEWA